MKNKALKVIIALCCIAFVEAATIACVDFLRDSEAAAAELRQEKWEKYGSR